MNYWLFKTEPGTWSWDDQLKRGDLGEEWDGVRNYQARNNMRLMEIGDLGFFYHSVHEKRIMGIVEVCALAHQDRTTNNPAWECVDIKAVREVPIKPTLADIKANPALDDMILVKNSRLSVQPVLPSEWEEIRKMAGDL